MQCQHSTRYSFFIGSCPVPTTCTNAILDPNARIPTINILPNSIQPRPVDRNLVVDLVGLTDYAVDVLVLAVDLFAHGLTEGVESSCTAVDGVPIV